MVECVFRVQRMLCTIRQQYAAAYFECSSLGSFIVIRGHQVGRKFFYAFKHF